MSAQATDELSPLARQYALRLCSLTLVVLLVSGVVQMVFGYRETLRQTERLQATLAESAAREIDTYLTGLENALGDVAKLPWGRPGFGDELRREEFYRLMRTVPAVIEMAALSPSGEVQMRLSRDLVEGKAMPLPVLPEELVQRAAIDGIAYGSTFFRQGELPTLYLAAHDGRGAVVATVDLRLLGEIVERMRAGEQGVAYIVDAEGTLVAHTRATEVLAHVNLMGSDALTLARDATGGAVRLSAHAGQDWRGRPVIATAVNVKRTDWMVFVEQPRSSALQPVFATLSRTVVLMVVGGLAALVLGVWMARRMAAPIVALRNLTERIVSGQLESQHLITRPLMRHNEVTDVADDVALLAQRLREFYAGLEAKVVERTAELALRKDEAERANTAKTRFLAAASHDLRQPMHSISLLIGVLRTRLNDPAQIDIADKVQSSVTTMENLFGNLLDISKLDAGAVHPHIEDVDLGWLLDRAAQTWLPQAQEKGLTLRVRPGRWVVRGDATLLERIVGNLLANAIRYTRSGGVLVGCRRRGEHCELQIWDTGPGIAEEYREAIFEEFFRIGAPGTSQEKGLGLGLSIVRRCVYILGYSISVQSREGRGSVFKVTLPLAAGSVVPHAISSTMDPPPQALEGNFIVVVDDEATNREAVRDALLAAGCHVVIAYSGDEALAQLQAHLRTPDLILTDFQLGSSGDGLDVIRRLRAHYDEEIPALVVTANTDTRLVAEAGTLGAGLLHKPVGLQRLLLALKESLETT
ncbi:hybrid sensor histidine kinase/response regulator [Roseateles sp. NT4]|uniref:hybrid sensor histidine kinase/response regulator n=1 Tax=Roseateles sp. NT4 TaxID=3453715 RepID=UPI003EF04276